MNLKVSEHSNNNNNTDLDQHQVNPSQHPHQQTLAVSTESEKINDLIFIEEQSKVNLLNNNINTITTTNNNNNKNLIDTATAAAATASVAKQTFPILTSTFISPSISPAQLLNLNIDSNQIHKKTASLIRSNSVKYNNNNNNNNNNTNNSGVASISGKAVQTHPYQHHFEPSFITHTSESLNSNTYFKYKQSNLQPAQNNSNLSINSSSNGPTQQVNKANSNNNNNQLSNNNNSGSTELIYNSNNSLYNNSMVANHRYQDPTMTQFTKYTKNIFTDSYNSPNASNTKLMIGSPSNDKSPSRGSMTNGINGTPLSLLTSATLQKNPLGGSSPNSSNHLIKNDRIKMANLGRSVTMKYTKSYLDSNGNLNSSPTSTTSASLNKPVNQTNHFNYSNTQRKSFHYTPVSTPMQPQPHQHQHQQQPPQQQTPPQQATPTAEQAPISKKDFLSVLNSIQRSTSIKLGREKTSLMGNYFSTQNPSHSIVNANCNFALNYLSTNTAASPNNSLLNQTNNTSINSASYSKMANKKQQPISLRNSNQTLNITQKNSISLENVYNNLDNVISAVTSNSLMDSNRTLNQQSYQKSNFKTIASSTNNQHLLNNRNSSKRLIQNENLNYLDKSILNDESIEIKELQKPNKTILTTKNTQNQKNGNYDSDDDDEENLNTEANKQNNLESKLPNSNTPNEEIKVNNNNNKAGSMTPPQNPSQLSSTKKDSLDGQGQAVKVLHRNSPSKNSKQQIRPLSKISFISRDVNDSYAYTNVKQYIEENDLMPPEKAEYIKRWVKEVNTCYDDWEKRTIEINIIQE